MTTTEAPRTRHCVICGQRAVRSGILSTADKTVWVHADRHVVPPHNVIIDPGEGEYWHKNMHTDLAPKGQPYRKVTARAKLMLRQLSYDQRTSALNALIEKRPEEALDAIMTAYEEGDTK